jgi:predicted ATP-grasp superfamily ATP-dependent carboligase
MDKAVLIVAASGRALAASARRAGYMPLVVDFFGDSDTLDVAHAHAPLPEGLARGITADALDAAVASVTAALQPCGVVCGTGFDDRPSLIAHLAKRWRVYGNSAETIVKLKDPLVFSSLCDACGVPYPEIALARPTDANGWLAKRKGGAGGSHIRPAAAREPASDIYYQRRVAGTAISLQFLADGRNALILGSSAQWTAPAPSQPFRYGGAVRPAELPTETTAALAECVRRVVAATQLVGLNSADFLVEGDRFRLLEINTRPSATLDIFEPLGGSLFALHMAACDGVVAAEAPRLFGATAMGIVFAERDVTVPALEWPDWIVDRPHAGTEVKAGEPLCTVHASTPTAVEARELVDARLARVLAWTHARIP